MTAELARFKLGRVTADDDDGYQRVMCPAAMGKLRCPLRPESMTASHTRPEALTPPSTCRHAAPSKPSPSRPRSNAKTRQKHDYPSKAQRISYARRTGAERTFSTVKDPATNDIARGWWRLTGVTAITLFSRACSW